MAHLVRVECQQQRCGHSATYDPHELWSVFWRKGWDDDFRAAQQRFYCRPCTKMLGSRVKLARMSDLGSGEGEVTHRLPLMANARDWKNFLNRHKG